MLEDDKPRQAGVVAKALMPATVGEWLQGWLYGQEALVSLVVDWKGSVELRRRDGDAVKPLDEKAREAFSAAKRVFGESALRGVYPVVSNPLPRAKGFATSTMDIAGILVVCAEYAGLRPSAEEIFSLCAAIEPSDGIMFEGLALVDHINGRLIERLPSPPGLGFLVLVPARTLDTEEYRKDGQHAEKVRALADEHERSYSLLKEGLQKRDAREIAEAATLSASAQQKILPRGEWELLRKARELFGVLGIAVAHSGTASALIFEEGDAAGMDAAERWLYKMLNNAGYEIRRAQVCGGGISSFL